MKIAVIQFPGSNCERETIQAIERVGMQAVSFLWNEDASILHQLDGFVIVGGFSYEDRSRAGVLAAHDPVMDVIRLQNELGKPILGLCNGAQILVESGLVPGVEGNRLSMALTENQRELQGKTLSSGYYNEWVWMRLSKHYQRNAFTQHIKPADVLRIPIAHAEGRFVLGEGLAEEVRENGLNVFQYCDENGEIIRDFPVNPNGSWDNTAAISNKRGNVMAMMPHPERTLMGDVIFSSMRDYISGEPMPLVNPLNYFPREYDFSLYQHKPDHDCIIISDLVDLVADSVQSTLQRMGYAVLVRSFRHWRVNGSKNALKTALLSEELHNPRKEHVVLALSSDEEKREHFFLVQPKQDWRGRSVLEKIHRHHSSDDIESIESSVVWQFSSPSMTGMEIRCMLEETHIIHNPFVQDCYVFPVRFYKKEQP